MEIKRKINDKKRSCERRDDAIQKNVRGGKEEKGVESRKKKTEEQSKTEKDKVVRDKKNGKK